MTPGLRRRGLRLLGLVAALAVLAAGGCSEQSPQGRELAAPSDREAAPVGEAALDRPEPERKEEKLEEFGVDAPEPGEAPPAEAP